MAERARPWNADMSLGYLPAYLILGACSTVVTVLCCIAAIYVFRLIGLTPRDAGLIGACTGGFGWITTAFILLSDYRGMGMSVASHRDIHLIVHLSALAAAVITGCVALMQ
jgi:hypothetical protein